MHAIPNGSLNTHEDPKGVPKKTPLVILWSLTTLIWSIFTPPHRTFAARMILFQPVWLLRAFAFDDAAWVSDLLIFEIVHAVYGYVTGVWRFPIRNDFACFNVADFDIQMYLQVFTLLAVCAVFAGLIVTRGAHLDSVAATAATAATTGLSLDGGRSGDAFPSLDQSQPPAPIEEQVLPPLLLTSRTTHSRLIPNRHAFSYSYLFVGIPVGAVQGRVGNALSVDVPPRGSRGWFDVDARDYLDRGMKGTGSAPLAEKLKRYLQSQGVTDRDYAFAYLVTAPRFLGYSFNPVSFWYLYDADTRLKYMVLEVNNTFDERRMYLLQPAKEVKGEDTKGVDPDVEKHFVFGEVWDKDFHVSPFNDREGSYSLRAVDPLAAYERTGQVRIDNTIVLRTSSSASPASSDTKDATKIVARVYTEGKPQNPTTISSLQLTRFILTWWWVGFATFPRIVWEAARLFFQRRLPVWFRPEVTTASLGRSYDTGEVILEAFFRAFLTQAVHESITPLRVIYEPAHPEPDALEVVLYSPGFTYEEDQQRTLTLKVLSPAFYSRFVHYRSAREAFEVECLNVDEKNRTVEIQSPDLLPTLLDAFYHTQLDGTTQPAFPSSLPPPTPQATSISAASSTTSSSESRPRRPWLLERIKWSMLNVLRCPPAAQSYSNPSPPSQILPAAPSSMSLSRSSELDHFVRRHCHDRVAYRHVVTRLFLAQRFVGGIPALLDAVNVGCRVAIVLLAIIVFSTPPPPDSASLHPWSLAWWLTKLRLNPIFSLSPSSSSTVDDVLDILRPRPWRGTPDVYIALSLFTWANVVHIWSLVWS